MLTIGNVFKQFNDRLKARGRDETSDGKTFGTWDGVFLPTLLTILGAVMYLRTGWVVGNAGLVGGVLIILLANVITIATGLSIASVATNIRVGAGGAFSIIAQSLGLEVSGSVTVPFYLAQSISVAFYIFAFSEGWLRIFPTHPEWLVVLAAFAVVFLIAYVSVKLAAQVRYPILFIVSFSLISILLGTFRVMDAPGITQTPVLWGNFPHENFWSVFAVFFPAVTGVLVGVNMSGTLKNPRKSIPRGIIGAILVTVVIYVALAVWVSLVATPQELLTNLTIMVDRSAFGWAILAGILAATFSAALNSLVGAPRVLQAIAQHDILPGSEILARTSRDGEPHPAMFLTGIIGVATLLFGLAGGGLNAIAPLMTMFFLITYAVLNGVVVLEKSLKLVSFRPHFQIPDFIPVVGLVGSVVVMFLINPIFSLVALIVILFLYSYLSHRQLRNPFSDVRSGLFVTVAEWAAMQVMAMPDTQERAWKPSLLVPAQSPLEVLGAYRFLKALTYPRGLVHIIGMYPRGKKERVEKLEEVVQAFAHDQIFARLALIEADKYYDNLRTALDVVQGSFFHPNALFMTLTEHTSGKQIEALLKQAEANAMGVILYRQHLDAQLGREQCINVWIREQSPDWQIGMRLSHLDLSLLLAYQIIRNWGGHITLITVVQDEKEEQNGRLFLASLVELGRMPKNTEMIVKVGNFEKVATEVPRADLSIFGLQASINLQFTKKMVELTASSCIFVQDSGNESALA